MKKVAVVILNWNGKELMEQFLPSVIAHSPQETAEIVVADNGSTDASVAMLEEKFPSVRIIRIERNYGFAEGYNKAIEEIGSPYVVLLNSDVEVTPHWLDAPLALLDTEPDVAGVQPKLLAQRNKHFFEYAGAAGGLMDKYGYPYCRGRIFHVVEEDRGQYDAPMDVLWGSGACLFLRTEVYKKEGGLDARFFAHQEEIDFCWRLRARGYRLVCTPRSVVYHVGGATLNAESPRKIFLNFRNNLLMLYKNLPEKDLLPVMRCRFWLDYLAAAKFLLTFNFRNAKAVYEARKEFYQLKETYVPIRMENLRKTTVPQIPEILQSNLILSFYFKGKKKYSDFKTIPENDPNQQSN
ncbi:glycosyltransferase family 2 protein [Parabacteroides sp. Marseille-P3160]|uniref:glycosyltransferase family 2 protein n=1 Tax=Parabacteroides sp. Marseille-P3160 TaxID=1917887 RepID=UPI0009BABF08|nr:glycosyltransferase family 2 protein [Parabacteroides sp. Marseille-P3160]